MTYKDLAQNLGYSYNHVRTTLKETAVYLNKHRVEYYEPYKIDKLYTFVFSSSKELPEGFVEFVKTSEDKSLSEKIYSYFEQYKKEKLESEIKTDYTRNNIEITIPEHLKAKEKQAYQNISKQLKELYHKRQSELKELEFLLFGLFSILAISLFIIILISLSV